MLATGESYIPTCSAANDIGHHTVTRICALTIIPTLSRQICSLLALKMSQMHLKCAFIMPTMQEGQVWRWGLIEEQVMLATAVSMKSGGYFALADLSLRFADRSLSFAGAADIRLCFRLPSARPGS